MRVKAVRTSAPLEARPSVFHMLRAASPTHEEIAARAYQHYLERGMDHGDDVEDWLRAEQELQQELDGERMAEAA